MILLKWVSSLVSNVGAGSGRAICRAERNCPAERGDVYCARHWGRAVACRPAASSRTAAGVHAAPRSPPRQDREGFTRPG